MSLVSVVIPAFNQAAFVRQAIDSVLAQSHDQVEAIVVNDGSTDGTASQLAAYAGEPRVRVIDQANAGLPAARNRGLAQARGEFVTFLDADDLLDPAFVERLIAPLLAEPSLAFAYADVQHVDVEGRPSGDYSVGASREVLSGDILPSLVIGGYFPPHAVLLRRSVIGDVGAFDEDLGGHADYELWLRIAASGRTACYVDDRLAIYRQHPTSMSRDTAHMRATRERALARVAARFPERVGRAMSALQSALVDAHESNQWMRKQWQPLLASLEAERGARRWSLLDSVAAATQTKGRPDQMSVWDVEIGGQSDRCLFLHPPAALEAALPGGTAGRLKMAVALHPRTWQESGAGACLFSVTVDGAASASALLDPVRREGDRRWVEVAMDLPATTAAERRLVVETQSVGSDRFVHALVRDVQLFDAA